MKMKSPILVLYLILIAPPIFCQEGNWDVYIAQYEKGPGSVTVNMDLINFSPKKHLPFVVITGVKTKKCSSEGWPDKEEFDNLYKVSDDIISAISVAVKSELVGSWTYQCERLDYIYVDDTTNIRQKIREIYKNKYSHYESYFNIRLDREWQAYRDFLYPNEETFEYMQNNKVIMQLVNAGDKLSKARQVDHWIYFKNPEDRNKFEDYVRKNKYKIEGKDKLKDSKSPYQLHISRTDLIDHNSINAITIGLRKKAKELNGDYDGWETFVVKE
jgi:hypothetical protein